MDVRERTLAGALSGFLATFALSALRVSLDHAVFGAAWGLVYWLLTRRRA